MLPRAMGLRLQFYGSTFLGWALKNIDSTPFFGDRTSDDVLINLKNVFDCSICQNSPSRNGVLFASTDVVHTPRSDFPLHFDFQNI